MAATVRTATTSPTPSTSSVVSSTVSNPPTRLSVTTSLNAKEGRKTASELFAGGCAGAVAKTLIAPLDRTKIIFQTSEKRKFSWSAVRQELKRIVQEEGVTKLWKGHSATLSRVAPYAAIQFASFDFLKRRLPQPPLWWELVLSGATAGAISVAVTYPLDLMRARMAVGYHTGSVFTNLLQVYRDRGIHALYRGLNPTLLGILPYAGISFSSFETLKREVKSFKHGNDITTVERLGCGALAGFLAQSLTYPLDIVRRRMQIENLCWSEPKYQTVLESFRVIIREEGHRGLTKAISMNAVKGPIAVGVSFTTHDFILRMLGSSNSPKH
jgi:solute carrier family 25 protein 42